MNTTSDELLETMQALVAEEAHLIGQELQDALNKHQLHRLSQLSSDLNAMDGLLDRRRAMRGPGTR